MKRLLPLVFGLLFAFNNLRAAEIPPIFKTSLFYPMTYGKYSKEVFTDIPDAGSSSPSSYIPIKKYVVVTLLVPTEDARVFVQGKLIEGKGFARQFLSPDLEFGKKYMYCIEVNWKDKNGKVRDTAIIEVRAGERYFHNFNRDPAERILKGH